MGQVHGQGRLQGADLEGQPRGPVAGGGEGASDDVAWRRKIIRWQNVRSGEPGGVPAKPGDPAQLTPTRRRLRALRLHATQFAGVVLPPLFMLGLLGLVWQLLCSSP